ncbi:putative glucan endo-1,3-beta-glucosidase A6-like protein [Corchorus olitorius]|uniref:Glucan endo-1,3-beta-glucosidase A6-like protein n=1 Tax=Corchorus olitorius TaxID=93759 RepID=A0A1R3JM51_9ROSI|nr:putative glucan endo-1,3-beta-glucosidase A6-like protein [Corchorus olitorius]
MAIVSAKLMISLAVSFLALSLSAVSRFITFFPTPNQPLEPAAAPSLIASDSITGAAAASALSRRYTLFSPYSSIIKCVTCSAASALSCRYTLFSPHSSISECITCSVDTFLQDRFTDALEMVLKYFGYDNITSLIPEAKVENDDDGKKTDDANAILSGDASANKHLKPRLLSL